jgi:chromosome segregation ATPase
MNITLEELKDERQKLTNDFNELKDKIQKVEVDLGGMKGNLNALNGAIQFSTNLITMATNKEAVLKKVKKTKNEKI